MHPYVVVPILACTITAATAISVWTRDPGNRRVWPIAAVSALASVWAFCEIAWNLSADAASALAWMRISALGWVPIGPAAFHALMVARDRDTKLVRGAIRAVYAASGLLLIVALTSPLMIGEALRTWWGWSPVPGPAMGVQYAVTGGSVGAGLLLGWIRASLSREERRRVIAVRVAIGVPLVVASVTDVILPILGVFFVPRLGTLSLALIGFVHVWSFVRYGDSILVPEGLTARVLRTLPDGMASLTLSGHVRAVNERLAEWLGTTPADFAGRPLAKHLSLNVLEPAREVHDLECRLLPVHGPAMDVSLSTSLQYDNLGRASGLVLIARDLRELMTLRSRLLTSGRMAAVGELAAGIAHELNNPLAYVRANLSMLGDHFRAIEKELAGSAAGAALAPVLVEAEEIVEESLEGIGRAAGIVRDVREFSHAGSGERVAADPCDLVQQSVRVARLQLPANAEVNLLLGELPAIECEPQRLKQLFLNLLVNAAQAVGEGGRIGVRGCVRDGGIELAFRDDGCGIAPEHLDRIFDPFFTTKPVGVGTGLGLAIAFRTVEEHGGRISVSSAPGAGTEFRVWLPLSQSA
jgi:signal transduction histidine kinase